MRKEGWPWCIGNLQDRIYIYLKRRERTVKDAILNAEVKEER